MAGYIGREIIGKESEAVNNNVIINGDFQIWQRGTLVGSPPVLTPIFTGITTNTYTADRFKLNVGGNAGTWTVQQTADHPIHGSNGSCFEAIVTTAQTPVVATTFGLIDQRVEGYSYLPLYQQSQTVSFWVKSNVTGTYSISLRNSFPNRAYTSEFTINTANTWEKKTHTITAVSSGGTWNFTNGIGILVGIVITGGSDFQTSTLDAWTSGNKFVSTNQTNLAASVNNYIRVTDIKLEPGTIATPFVPRSFGEELALCQRYYETGRLEFTGYVQSTSIAMRMTNRFAVTKRDTPAMTFTAGDPANLDIATATISSDGSDHLRSAVQGTIANNNVRFFSDWTADAEF